MKYGAMIYRHKWVAFVLTAGLLCAMWTSGLSVFASGANPAAADVTATDTAVDAAAGTVAAAGAPTVTLAETDTTAETPDETETPSDTNTEIEVDPEQIWSLYEGLAGFAQYVVATTGIATGEYEVVLNYSGKKPVGVAAENIYMSKNHVGILTITTTEETKAGEYRVCAFFSGVESVSNFFPLVVGPAGDTEEPGGNKGGAATVTYAGAPIKLGDLKDLFTIHPGAGTPTYTLGTSGTGVGSIAEGTDLLTVTKAGTFNISLTTPGDAAVTGTLIVAPKTLTITGVSAVNRDFVDEQTTVELVYDGTLNGVLSGDEVTAVVPKIGSLLADGKETDEEKIDAAAAAGDDKPVTIATITLSGKDAGKYTLTQPAPGSATVDIAPISLTGAAVEVRIAQGSDGSLPRLGQDDILTAYLAGIPAGATGFYQWYRDGEAISGATKKEYTVGDTSADPVGSKLHVVVTAKGNVVGEITSETVTVITRLLTGSVDITNNGTEVGDVLTLDTSTVRPSGAAYSIRWLRDGGTITNATYSTYTIASADRGCTIGAEITGTGLYKGTLSDSISIPSSSSSDAPRDVYATPGDTQATLHWNAPSSGYSVSRYEVYRTGQSGSWISVGMDTSHVFTGLTNGTSYTFRVRAVFSGGGTGAEGSATATPRLSTTAVPGVPRSLIATPGAAQVKLAWTAPSTTGGSAITKYQVQKGSDAWIDATGLTYTYTGLTGGTSYTFHVRAVNGAGAGAYATATATPTKAAAVTPPNTGATTGATDADVEVETDDDMADSYPAGAQTGSGGADADFDPVAMGTNAGVIVGQNILEGTDGTLTLPTGGDFNTTAGTRFSVPSGTRISVDGVVGIPAETDGFGAGIAVTFPDGRSLSIRQDVTVILNEATPLGYSIVLTRPFDDVGTDAWYNDDTSFIYGHGLMLGTNTSPPEFSPDESTTRGMVVTILYRIAGSPDVSGLANPFPDVPGDEWYADAVTWAAASGVVTGTDAGAFEPSNTITREDMSVILARYADASGIPMAITRPYAGFDDAGEISEYASAAVAAAYEAGIINGKPPNSFDPRGLTTRAEVSAMLHRFLAQNA